MGLLSKFLGGQIGLGDRIGLEAACGSDTGKRRKNNEDNFYFDGESMPANNAGTPSILTREVPERQSCYFAVLDGMGGGDYGEIASSSAAEAIHGFLSQDGNVNPCDITPSLTALCRQANESVFRAGENLGAYQMGSTLVSFYFHQDQVWVCDLGDSRGYLMRDDMLIQLSVDHTDEAEMKANNITGRKPKLTQYLGIDPEVMTIVPYIRSRKVKPGDRFLLCSDGVTDMVEEDRIRQLLRQSETPHECVRRLIDAALEAGGRDNITAIVVDVQ